MDKNKTNVEKEREGGRERKITSSTFPTSFTISISLFLSFKAHLFLISKFSSHIPVLISPSFYRQTFSFFIQNRLIKASRLYVYFLISCSLSYFHSLYAYPLTLDKRGKNVPFEISSFLPSTPLINKKDREKRGKQRVWWREKHKKGGKRGERGERGERGDTRHVDLPPESNSTCQIDAFPLIGSCGGARIVGMDGGLWEWS